MNQPIRESDWKVFRSLHKVALDRFCKRVLDEAAAITGDNNRTHHERYLALFALIKKRDEDVARMFDELKRSTAKLHLLMLWKDDLLTDAEIGRFSPELQEWLRRATDD